MVVVVVVVMEVASVVAMPMEVEGLVLFKYHHMDTMLRLYSD